MLAKKYPGRSTWVMRRITNDGFVASAWLGAEAGFCTPTLLAEARAPFAPEAWSELLKKL